MTSGIGPDDAATVAELLREIAMEHADLATVAWLLRDASAQRRMPVAMRDRARYWATYLYLESGRPGHPASEEE